MIHLHASRIDYTDTTTIALLAVNGTFWGYTLEDRRRPPGLKIHGKTCIPAGKYRLRVTRSARFEAWLPELENVPGFSGIRLHGGNTHADTEGCPLIAKTRIDRERIQGSLVTALMEYLRSQIQKVPGETEAAFWSRLPETWYTVQDGPLAGPYLKSGG